MSNKIEFIELNGREYNVSIFPEEIRNMVNTFEITRGEYNKSAVTTAALGEHMNNLNATIEYKAAAALKVMLGLPPEGSDAPSDEMPVPEASDAIDGGELASSEG